MTRGLKIAALVCGVILVGCLRWTAVFCWTAAVLNIGLGLMVLLWQAQGLTLTGEINWVSAMRGAAAVVSGVLLGCIGTGINIVVDWADR